MNELQSSTKFLNIDFDTVYYLYYLQSWNMGEEFYEDFPTGIIPVYLGSATFEEDDDECKMIYDFLPVEDCGWDDGIEIDLADQELLLFTSKKEAKEFKADFAAHVILEHASQDPEFPPEELEYFILESIIDYASNYNFFFNHNLRTIFYDDLLYRDCVFKVDEDDDTVLGHCSKNTIWFTQGMSTIRFNQYYSLSVPFCNDGYFVGRDRITSVSESQQLGGVCGY